MRILNFLRGQLTPPTDFWEGGSWSNAKVIFMLGEGVTMTFTEGGKLIYVIRQKGSKQIMNLVYRVNGSHLITDQPSSPKEESTEFSFDSKGDLLLKFAGGKAWFARA